MYVTDVSPTFRVPSACRGGGEALARGAGQRLQCRHLPTTTRLPVGRSASAIAARRASAPARPARAAAAAPARPFLKWAGGKGQIAPALVARSPRRIATYYEPFLGGGALFFALAADPDLAPRHAMLNDRNRELITVYEVVRNDLERLLARLGALAAPYLEAAPPERTRIYYEQREREPEDRVDLAARFIFLNKTCFNGLYRVNRRGEFNVPHGRYQHPRILDEPALRAAAAALRGVALECVDFAEAVAAARPGDFVYMDPPFEPLSKTSSFTGYTEGAFDRHEQLRLKWLIDGLTEQGVAVMLSNSPAEWVVGVYQGQRGYYHIDRTPARRSINSRGDRRGAIDELIVTNYPPELSRERLESAASEGAEGAAAGKAPRGAGSTK